MCLSSAPTTGQNFLKASSAISAKGTTVAETTGRSSDKRRPSPTSGDSFALSGSDLRPDPQFHAYRKDLADVCLAGSVIASHYAQAVDRRVVAAADLYEAPGEQAGVIRQLQAGELFRLLDDSGGWAWGYAGSEGRVGFVRSELVAPS